MWARLRGLSPLSSVQGKMVAVFLLLTYAAMQVISLGLVNRAQAALIQSTQVLLKQELLTITAGLQPSSSEPLAKQIPQQPAAASLNLWLVNAPGAEPQLLSGVSAQQPPSSAVRRVLAGAASASHTLVCPPPAAQAVLVWCIAPVVASDGGTYALAGSTSLGQIYQIVHSVSHLLLPWTLVALLVIGGLSLLVARSITGPIEALTRRARAMAAGDFSTRLPVQSHDEVGQLAQMFNHLGRRLQETEAVRKEIVANVSHELRTPVTTIKLYTESLLEWGLDDPATARPKLEVIAAETDRMVGLIGDLLDLSRIDRRTVLRNPERTDLADLAESVAKSQQARAEQKGVALRVDAAGPCEAVIDPERIIQVLANLVSNAIDFTPEGGSVALTVSCGHGEVAVSVTDTGVGIPQADLPRIFDRFYRVDPSRSREHGGSGLGLAIAREIVEAHGGSIRADSTVGKGTTIRFTLPAADGDPA